jgi:hypothetical protein
MEARRKPVLVPESATPNLDAAQRYAARGTPLVGDMADLEIGQQEDVATQRVVAAEVQPHLRVYVDDYARNLDVAYRAMQDPDNFDRGRALGEIMQNLTNDIAQIPADYDGPLRQEMVGLYTKYATKAKLATMTDADGVAELERDTKLFPGVKTALARFRTEHKPKEAVPPPSVAQTGEGIDRHLQATLATIADRKKGFLAQFLSKRNLSFKISLKFKCNLFKIYFPQDSFSTALPMISSHSRSYFRFVCCSQWFSRLRRNTTTNSCLCLWAAASLQLRV